MVKLKCVAHDRRTAILSPSSYVHLDGTKCSQGTGFKLGIERAKDVFEFLLKCELDWSKMSSSERTKGRKNLAAIAATRKQRARGKRKG